MSNSYIFYNFRAEIQGTGSRSEVTVHISVSLARRSSVAKSRAMLRRCHSRSLEVIRIYAVE